MAPEQIEGREVDARSDLFSFGAVVFEMLTGRRAFDGDSAASVRAAILEHEPPSVSSLQPLAPPAWTTSCAAVSPRIPTSDGRRPSDVIRELKQVFESIGQARTQAPPTDAGSEAGQAWRWVAAHPGRGAHGICRVGHGGRVPALVDEAAVRPDSIRRGAAARRICPATRNRNTSPTG